MPTGPQVKPSAYQYFSVRDNGILMKHVHLGFSFFDENCQPAPDRCAWQFHFKFDVEEDVPAEEFIPAF